MRQVNLINNSLFWTNELNIAKFSIPCKTALSAEKLLNLWQLLLILNRCVWNLIILSMSSRHIITCSLHGYNYIFLTVNDNMWHMANMSAHIHIYYISHNELNQSSSFEVLWVSKVNINHSDYYFSLLHITVKMLCHFYCC